MADDCQKAAVESACKIHLFFIAFSKCIPRWP